MNLYYLVAFLVIRLVLGADSSISSWMTRTVVVTNNGATYTKTPVDLYTGQDTTTPTSGTFTTTIRVSNSLETYTKTMVKTYGLVSGTTTHLTVEGPSETYTKTLSTTIVKSSSGSDDSSSSASTDEESTSSSEAGAAELQFAGTLMAFAAAVLLL